MIVLLVAVQLIELNAVDGTAVEIAAQKIVALKTPRAEGGALHPTVGCIVTTNDGKFITVKQTCAQVRGLLQ